MKSPCPCARDKVVAAESLTAFVAERQKRGEKIVFTNGVFDILHVGHVRYLAEARALGDALIVAVNSDASVRGLKGDSRPIVPEDERAEMLASLACVDFVTLFETPTPVPLLTLVQPAIYVKGGDYAVDALPETPVVRSYGGDVCVLQFVPGRSTTDIIARVQALARKQSK